MTDEQESTPPSIRDSFAAAARRSGLGKVAPGENPSGSALLAAMGGVRGLVESILPGLGFLVVYTITQQLLPSVLFPLGLAVIFVLVRVVARQAWTSAVAGVVGIALSAGLALLTGRAEDNRLVHFEVPVGSETPRPGDVATVTVTHAAPFHLLADSPDGAPLRIRRTRAGDAWDRSQAESCGVPAPAGDGGPRAVSLGLPTLRIATGR